MLRVAAANCISLSDLLEGLYWRYGQIFPNEILDYSLSEVAVKALSQFCRVAPKRIRALDLHRRAPHLCPELLLRFQTAPLLDSRCSRRRVRYGFCPLCIGEQPLIYAHWDWSVSCLICCSVHGTLLLDDCWICHEPDPLIFSGFEFAPDRHCRSCGGDLTRGGYNAENIHDRKEILAVENAYRAALIGVAPDPTLLGKTTDRAFRQFVGDLLRLLTCRLTSEGARGPVQFPRRDIIQIVAELILNAVPTSEQSARSKRHSRGLTLWATLLSIISPQDGAALGDASLHWPLVLRRRFESALNYRTRKRWPFSPYQPSKNLAKRIEREMIASVYNLKPNPKDPSQ
jgi:TniQ